MKMASRFWIVLILLMAVPAVAKPVFVGAGPKSCEKEPKLVSLSYLTAEEMAEKIRAMTGFYQAGFEEFGSIIGQWDPVTGTRTNDQPTIMSVMVVGQLVSDVAQSVYDREIFLDEADRVVFVGLDLGMTPDDDTLAFFSQNLCREWLGISCQAEMERMLIEDFRAAEAQSLESAWVGLIGEFLQTGTIYFY